MAGTIISKLWSGVVSTLWLPMGFIREQLAETLSAFAQLTAYINLSVTPKLTLIPAIIGNKKGGFTTPTFRQARTFAIRT